MVQEVNITSAKKKLKSFNTHNHIHQEDWVRWKMQTARKWSDIADIISLTGIEMIDRDHKKMTEYALHLNQLIQRYEKEGITLKSITKQKKLLGDLYSYTCDHFKREEQMMIQFNMDCYTRHKKQHSDILLLLKEMIKDFDAGRVTISINLKLAILEWVVVHINEVDFHDFSLKNWQHVLLKAQAWEEISFIIKKTGLPTIDEDHCQLVKKTLKITHHIEGLLKNGDTTASPELQEQLDDLLAFTKKHFIKEEGLINRYSLEGYDKESRQHKKFIILLEQFIEKFNDDLQQTTVSFKLKILEWWINHINELDYRTFHIGNWSRKVIERATCWEDVSSLIKKMDVEQIDREHVEMTVKALELSQLVGIDVPDNEKQAFKNRSVKVIEELYDIAVRHFETEYHYIKEQNIEGLDQQHHQHSIFLNTITGFKADIQAERIAISEELKTAILDWWVNHINGVDYQIFVVNRA